MNQVLLQIVVDTITFLTLSKHVDERQPVVRDAQDLRGELAVRRRVPGPDHSRLPGHRLLAILEQRSQVADALDEPVDQVVL